MRAAGAQVAGKSQALVQFLGGLAGEQRTYACLQLAATLVSQAEAQVLPWPGFLCSGSWALRATSPQARSGHARSVGVLKSITGVCVALAPGLREADALTSAGCSAARLRVPGGDGGCGCGGRAQRLCAAAACQAVPRERP